MATENVTPLVVLRATGPKGELQPLDLGDRLLTFAFDDNAKLIDQVNLTLDNFELELLDDERFRPGNELEVAWGYVDDLCEPRKMVITDLSGGVVLTIQALGEAVKMDRKTKGRSFEGKTRSAIVKQIADEYGFGADAEIEDTQVVIPSIVQKATLTDAQFIAELARKEKFEFYVKKSGLHFHRKNLAQDPIAQLTYYNGPKSGDFISFHYEEGHKANKKGKVKRKGKNPLTKQPHQAEGSNATTAGRPGLASKNPVPAEGVDGSPDLQFNKQSGETRYVFPGRQEDKPTSQTTEAAVKREAQADFLGDQWGAIKLKMEVVGRRTITARRVIQVAGIGSRLSGPWYVDKCVSKIGSEGFVQSLELTRDTHNGYGSKQDAKANVVPNKKDVKPPDEVEQNLEFNKQSGETRTTYTTKG